ncbi:MAG: hypothetical protein QXQ37_07025, partial [Nitrososphaerota archaeon]
KAAEEMEKILEAKGRTEGEIGRGELTGVLNAGGKRGKDLLTMALCKFTVGKIIKTPDWEMTIKEPDKPVVYFRILRKK